MSFKPLHKFFDIITNVMNSISDELCKLQELVISHILAHFFEIQFIDESYCMALICVGKISSFCTFHS
jgi:hypothetical protein